MLSVGFLSLTKVFKIATDVCVCQESPNIRVLDINHFTERGCFDHSEWFNYKTATLNLP